MISRHWIGADELNFLVKGKNRLSCLVNNTATDVLATKGARASVAVVLT